MSGREARAVMKPFRLGLRAKFLLALLVAGLVTLIPAAVVAGLVVNSIREYLGQAYAKNQTLLSRERIQAPVLRELALSQRLAASPLTRNWLADEHNTILRRQFFAEAESYRKAFRDQAYFIAVAGSRHYYFTDERQGISEDARYTLRPGEAADAWFFRSLRQQTPYNINVDINAPLQLTKVWINVRVEDERGRLGVTGSAVDLSGLLSELLGQRAAGVTPIIVNREGAIQLHPDATRIAYDSGSEDSAPQDKQKTLFGLVAEPAAEQRVRRLLAAAEFRPSEAVSDWITLQGERQLVAVAYMPELRWFVMTAVDLDTATVFDVRRLSPALLAGVLVLIVLLASFGYAAEQILIKPLRRLQQSARQIADGQYSVDLPPRNADEIGDLCDAFARMAAQVSRHTEQLEQMVAQRTQALETSNRLLADINRKMGDSIDYASLIQRAMLPDRALAQALGHQYAVIWQPRDVVGGDFYLFEERGNGQLLGVVDCAGHGVPGAMMAMLAQAAFQQTIRELGLENPAALLTRCEATLSAMLPEPGRLTALATSLDAALLYIDRERHLVRFAGAKLSLYVTDGLMFDEIRGDRRALGDRRRGQFVNTELPLHHRVCYTLATDGVLDQAGGEQGFGLGGRRFGELLRHHAHLPLAEQADALNQAIAAYQAHHPQRDDITILTLRLD